jgi:hypothetical protein
MLMIFERKLVKVVRSIMDIDLAFTEYKVSVYDEISTFLSDNNCMDGVNLVNKRKKQMASYVHNIKNDLAEIDNICKEISVLVKDLYKQKKSIPAIMNINNKKIYISIMEKNYSLIYSIEPDEYTKLFKYGIIEAEISKGRFYKTESKIGLSAEDNLVDCVNFKIYFNELLKEFNNVKNLEDLDFLKNKINYELSRLFSTENLREYLANKSEDINKLAGISGFDILRELHESYDIKRVKIILFSKGYSIENDKFIEAVRAESSCKKILDCLNNPDETENDIYAKELKKQSVKVKSLLNEINMSSGELEIAVSKVNSEIE